MLTDREIQILESCKFPNTYWKDKSDGYLFWMRALYERLTSTIDFTIPEYWSREFFNLILFSFGYMPVFKTERNLGGGPVTFQPANPWGYNWYYEPTHMQVVHTDMYNKKLEIGKDCEVLRLTNDWNGVWDIIDHYATLLCEATQSLKMQLINSKVSWILTADNEAAANTLKQVYDKIKLGETLIVYNNPDNTLSEEIMPVGEEPFKEFINNLRQNYLGTELIDNINSIMNQFYNEVGIVSESTEHGQSHTLNIEAEHQEEISSARLTTWLNNLNDSCKRINKMYNIGLEVKKHGNIENDSDGDAGLSESDSGKKSKRFLGFGK